MSRCCLLICSWCKRMDLLMMSLYWVRNIFKAVADCCSRTLRGVLNMGLWWCKTCSWQEYSAQIWYCSRTRVSAVCVCCLCRVWHRARHHSATAEKRTFMMSTSTVKPRVDRERWLNDVIHSFGNIPEKINEMSFAVWIVWLPFRKDVNWKNSYSRYTRRLI